MCKICKGAARSPLKYLGGLFDSGLPALPSLQKAGAMLPELLDDVSLFRVLHQIDQDLARACRQSGCPFCHSPLHNAPYTRKPRGGPANIPDEFCVRLSLCCSREDCRRRVLPPSCLFLGRKVYWRAVIVIIVTLRRRNPHSHSINMLARKFGISRRTVVRWIHYFREVFPQSRQWQRLRGLVSAQIDNNDLPQGLVNHFLHTGTTPAGGLIACLQFLASGHVT